MFKEFYYWMYWYIRKIKFNKDKDVEKAHSAYLTVSTLQAMNIMSVMVVVKYYLKIVLARNTTIVGSLLLAAILFTINYFYLYAKREVIFQKCENYTPTQKRKGKLIFWLYAILTNFVFFYLAVNLVTPKY